MIKMTPQNVNIFIAHLNGPHRGSQWIGNCLKSTMGDENQGSIRLHFSINLKSQR